MKTFVPGEIARASDVNANFTELSDRITNLTSGWKIISPSPGWVAVRNQAPIAMTVAGLVILTGAVIRRDGGFLTNLAVLPQELRPSRTQFIGATVCRHDNGNTAYAELYVSPDGQVAIESYTSIDNSAGWAVPLSATFYLMR